MVELKTDAEIAAMTKEEKRAYAFALIMELTPKERHEVLGKFYERHPEKKAAPDASNIQSGRVEKGLPTVFSTSSLPKNKEECKYET